MHNKYRVIVGIVAIYTSAIGLPGQLSLVGLSEFTVNSVYYSSDTPSHIIAGTNSGLFRINFTEHQRDTLLLGLNVIEIIGPMTNSDTLLVALGTPQSGILKSCDGGITWQVSDSGIYHNGGTGILTLEMDPLDHNILYAGTAGIMGGGLYKSYNYGENWEEIENSTYLLDGVIDIAINKNQPENIYVSTNQTGAVLKSSDGGDSWLALSVPWYEVGLPDVEIDPINNPFIATRIFAGVWGYGFAKSTDDGLNWEIQTSILGSVLESYRVVVLPDNSVSNLIYLGLDGGLYSGRLLYSEDAGENWHSLSDSLSVVCLYSEPTSGSLFIGTRTGIFRLESQSFIANDAPVNSKLFDVGLFPNPSNNRFKISISHQGLDPVLLEFYDISGNHLHSITLAPVNEQNLYYTWDLKSRNGGTLPSGVYFCRIQSGHFSRTIKMTAIY